MNKVPLSWVNTDLSLTEPNPSLALIEKDAEKHQMFKLEGDWLGKEWWNSPQKMQTAAGLKPS